MLQRSPDVVGVIVARFQVDKLHDGHKYLIDHVRARHKDVLIVLGVHGGVRTKKDPLTFAEREIMVRQSMQRKLRIKPLNDNPISHVFWARNLDALIQREFPGRRAVLYGSRNSFIEQYLEFEGHAFRTRYVKPHYMHSGSFIRANIQPVRTKAGRAAVIYAEEHRPDFIYSASDLVIEDPITGNVLVIGKRIHEGLFSFMGGHAMKTDRNGAETVVRERTEEIRGIEIGEARYIGNATIHDPRYRGTDDDVMSTLYHANYLGGTPEPDDDADSVHWIKPLDFDEALVPWHRPLGRLFVEHKNARH